MPCEQRPRTTGRGPTARSRWCVGSTCPQWPRALSDLGSSKVRHCISPHCYAAPPRGLPVVPWRLCHQDRHQLSAWPPTNQAGTSGFRVTAAARSCRGGRLGDGPLRARRRRVALTPGRRGPAGRLVVFGWPASLLHEAGTKTRGRQSATHSMWRVPVGRHTR